MTDTTDIKALREAALKATKLNLNTAQLVRDNSDKEYECPLCEGNGIVDGDVDYCNIDGVALGVQFYGIGPEHGLAENYFRSATPETILSLLDQLEAARQWVDRLGKELREVERLAGNELAEHAAELAALKGEQVPIAWLNDAHLARGHIEGEAGEEDAGPGMIPVYREKFTAQQKPVLHPDTKRMDWLCAHAVEVRDPQMYGSHAMFHAQQDSEEWDLPHHTTLREQVDAAIEAAGGIVSTSDERLMQDMSSIVKDGE